MTADAVPPSLERSSVFCILPWIHMDVQTDGRVLACCKTEEDPIGHLKDSTLREIWNSEAMRGLRRNMLAGKESKACEDCYFFEKLGAPTLRQDANRRFARHFPETAATRPDGGLDELRLPFLRVRFSNVCNFRCRTCNPWSSSAWYRESNAILKEKRFTRTLRPLADPKELWRQIEPLLSEVESLDFLGGEPLLMAENYRILKRLLELGRRHVRLSYNTNFSLTTFQGLDIMRLWDQFEDVFVAASLDGTGRRGEYLRTGQRWGQVIENRKRMFDVCPRAHFQIAPTFSLMSAPELPELHQQWVERGYIAPNNIMVTLLRDPKFYSAQALPAHLKLRIKEKYRDYVARHLTPLGEAGSEAQRHFDAAVEFMESEDRTNELERFREKTDLFDRMRGERFANVFPELAELMRPQGAASRSPR